MTTRQDLISLARHTRDSASLFVKDIGNGLLFPALKFELVKFGA